MGYCSTHEQKTNGGLAARPELLRAPNGQRTPAALQGLQAATTKHIRLLQWPRTATKGHRHRDADVPAANEGRPRILQLRRPHRQSKVEGILRSPHPAATASRTYGADPHDLRLVQIIPGAHHRCRALWVCVQQYPCIECGRSRRGVGIRRHKKDPSELYDTRHDWQLRVLSRTRKFPEFYMPMCKRCHKKLDMERLQMELQQFRGWRKNQRRSFGGDDGPPAAR